jgi:hypothetical protein
VSLLSRAFFCFSLAPIETKTNDKKQKEEEKRGIFRLGVEIRIRTFETVQRNGRIVSVSLSFCASVE